MSFFSDFSTYYFQLHILACHKNCHSLVFQVNSLFDAVNFCRRYQNTLYVTGAILAPCLSNLPSLILSLSVPLDHLISFSGGNELSLQHRQHIGSTIVWKHINKTRHTTEDRAFHTDHYPNTWWLRWYSCFTTFWEKSCLWNIPICLKALSCRGIACSGLGLALLLTDASL